MELELGSETCTLRSFYKDVRAKAKDVHMIEHYHG